MHHAQVASAVVACVLGAGTARGVLVDVLVDGRVVSNDVLVGRFAFVPPGTPVRFTVRVDTEDIFSDEPENFTTWYHVDYRLATLSVGDLPISLGLEQRIVSDSVVIFSGGDLYYQVDVPTVRLDLPEPTLLHCQFDGFRNNPFNNTGYIEQNLGVYDASVFESTRNFRVQVSHPGQIRDMVLEAETFTFVGVPSPGAGGALVMLGVGCVRRRRVAR